MPNFQMILPEEHHLTGLVNTSSDRIGTLDYPSQKITTSTYVVNKDNLKFSVSLLAEFNDEQNMYNIKQTVKPKPTLKALTAHKVRDYLFGKTEIIETVSTLDEIKNLMSEFENAQKAEGLKPTLPVNTNSTHYSFAQTIKP